MPAQHRSELEDILSDKVSAVESVGDHQIDDDDTEIVEEAKTGFCVECKDQRVRCYNPAKCQYASWNLTIWMHGRHQCIVRIVMNPFAKFATVSVLKEESGDHFTLS
jgi:hypothetical protein